VSAVWKALGHALAQDGRPAAAAAALKSAILTSDGDDLAARTGLATVLAQQGQASAALDELIAVRRAAGPSSSAAVLMEDAFERLCRKLYPGHRCSAVQNEARAAAWAGALQVACPEGGRVLDMSSTPLVAMIVAARLPVCRPVVRVEALPLSVSLEVLDANSVAADQLSVDAWLRGACTANSPGGTPSPQPSSRRPASAGRKATFVAARRNAVVLLPSPRFDSVADAVTLTLPPLAGVWEDAAGRPQPADVVTCDTDANDLFATCFLTALERARAVAPGKALILPERVEVWAALVCCPDLARLNARLLTRSICEASQCIHIKLPQPHEASERAWSVAVASTMHAAR